MKIHHSAAFILALILLSAPLAAQVGPLDWEGKPMALSASAIAKACASAKGDEGDGVVVFFEKDAYRFDDKGSALHEYHIAYKILTQKGLDAWNTATVHYQPWRQEKPAINARVIDAKGKASVLEQKTISDATARMQDMALYTDTRILDAPLPNLAVGSVVEYRIVVQDKAPLLDKGSLFRVWFAHGSRIEKRILEVDCPASMPLSGKPRGALDWKVTEEIPKSGKDKGRRIMRVVAEGIKGIRDVEVLLPSGHASVPRMEFTTGSSWAEVAAAYGKAVADVLRSPLPPGYLLADRSDRKKAVAELLYRMQKAVRYTGINFGANAIIPHTPAESISRGYGDCKDQASLLVSILEGNGIPARMALLCTGPGEDVPEDLPGFGLFDHAIVYLPEDRLWIDPTASLNALGVLPPADEGRLALVVDQATMGLLRIPASDSSANGILEEIDVFLPEYGSARIVERTTPLGNLEPDYRSYYLRAEEKQVRERLSGYAKSQYAAAALGKLSWGDPEDRSKPFFLELEAVDALLGSSDDSSAVFALRGVSLFTFLPDFLTEKNDSFTRSGPLELQMPYRAEYRYRVRAADGFRPAALPEDEDETWGPCTFSARFDALDDGSVSVVLRFDTGKRVFEADEVKAFRAGLMEFYGRDLYKVSFESIGGSLRSAGKYKEALVEYQRLADLHPSEALHRMQLADTLLQAGFTTDAAAQALEATRLEPGNARAWATLGFVRLHDPFGRMLEEGCDLPGVLAAYAEAERLDPKNGQYPFIQAVVHEYGHGLERYGRGARLDLAIEAYGRAAAIEKTDAVVGNAAIDRFRLGDYAGLKASGKGSLGQRTMQVWYLAAIAATDGTAAAQKEAARIITDAATRREVLFEAGVQLMNGRLYEPASVLIRDNAKGAKSQTQAIALANLLSGLKRFDAAALRPDESPVDLCKLFLGLACSSEPADAERMISLFSKRFFPTEEERRDAAGKFERAMASLLSSLGMPKEVSGDMLFSMMTLKEAAVGSAMAVVIDIPEIEKYEKQVIYIVREDGALRILSIGDTLENIGDRMWRLLEAGDEAGAREWHDLLAGQGTAFPGFPSLEGWAFLKHGAPVAMKGAKVADAATLRTEAAILLCSSDEDDDERRGVDWLSSIMEAETDKDRREALSYIVMSSAWNIGRADAGLKAAKAFLEIKSDHAYALNSYLHFLDETGRKAEADAFVRDKLKEDQSSGAWQERLARRLAEARDYPGAVDAYIRTIAAGKTDNLPYNNLVWFSLFMEKEPASMPKPDIVIKRLMAGSSAEIHTLVCYLAKEGRIMEAREAFIKLLSAMGKDVMDDSVWVAFGMLAESFGLRATATFAFERTLALSTDASDPGSCAELALIRMKAMGLRP